MFTFLTNISEVVKLMKTHYLKVDFVVIKKSRWGAFTHLHLG